MNHRTSYSEHHKNSAASSKARFRAARSSESARSAQKTLARWYLQNPALIEQLQAANAAKPGSRPSGIIQCFQMLREDAVAVLERFKALDEVELKILNELRDLGASVPETINYLRAEPKFNQEGRSVRKDVAASVRERKFQEQSQKIEVQWRSAMVVASGVAALALAGFMLYSGKLDVLPILPDVISEPLKWTWETLSGTLKDLATGGCLLLGWNTYKKVQTLRVAAPRLDLGKNEDFSDLPSSIGNPNYRRLNAQYESIPAADQHLIKHLSPTEARFFLLGGDLTRLHLLRTNQPTQKALIEREVEQLGRSGDHPWIRALRATWTLFSYPLSKKTARSGVPELHELLSDWRKFAQAERDETVKEAKKVRRLRI
jgi:hypothetical protein